MKLQTAIDRVTIRDAVRVIKEIDGKTDIIEMGTSLVKDYGHRAMAELRRAAKKSQLLIDLKTIDEGAYEFHQGYRHGGDILTAMGASSVATLAACYQVSEDYERDMMIDLLEVTDEKIKQITHFEHAIFCLHHSIDRADKLDAPAAVAEFHEKFPEVKRIAIAGGIDLAATKALAEQGLVEIVIVGSKITSRPDKGAAVKEFKEAIKK